jgi:hypothetical protein
MADTSDDDKKRTAERNKALYAFLKTGDLSADEARFSHQQAIANELRKESMSPGAGGWGGALARGLQGYMAVKQQQKADEQLNKLSDNRTKNLSAIAGILGINDPSATAGAAPSAAPQAAPPMAGGMPGIAPALQQQPQPEAPTGAPYSGQVDPLAMLKKRNPYDINPEGG